MPYRAGLHFVTHYQQNAFPLHPTIFSESSARLAVSLFVAGPRREQSLNDGFPYGGCAQECIK